jgi:hypothetical protein
MASEQLHVFANDEEFRSYFRRRTGSDAPYLRRDATPLDTRRFCSRLVRAFLHPDSADRELFLAGIRKSRALMLMASSVSAMTALLDLSKSHDGAFRAAKVDMRRVEQLCGQQRRVPPPPAAAAPVADGAEDADGSDAVEAQQLAAREPHDDHNPVVTPPPVKLTRYDLNLFQNIVHRLSSASEDTTVSKHYARIKATEAALTTFRTKMASTSAGAEWLRAPFVAQRLSEARAAFAAEASTRSASDGDSQSSDKKRPLEPPPAPSVAAVTKGPLTTATHAASLFDMRKVARAEYDSDVTEGVDPHLKAVDYELAQGRVVEYVDLVLAAKQAKRAWETTCPLRRAADNALKLQRELHKVFKADEKSIGEQAANSVKGRRGDRDGKALEDIASGDAGSEHVLDALRACGDLDEGDTSSSVVMGVEALTPANVATCRFIVVRNVDVKVNGKTIGELDAIVVDTAWNRVALVLEMKKTAADLGYARVQRERLYRALVNASADTPRGFPAAPPEFIVKGRHAQPYKRLVETDEAPALNAAAFDLFVREHVRRWVFVTLGGERPEQAPLPSNIAHVGVREMATVLALVGWSPDAATHQKDDDDDGGDHGAMSIAELAVAVLEQRASDEDLQTVIVSLAGAWVKSVAGDEEKRDALPLLEAEVLAHARVVRAVDVEHRDAAAPADVGFTTPVVAWVNVQLPATPVPMTRVAF